MTQEDPKLNYALRPDAQSFDEIRIRVVPRFKSSGLSGSEWRTSAVIEFYRKGKIVHSDGVGTMEAACGMLYAKQIEAIEVHGKGYFAGDGIHCDQEGCPEPATHVFKIKQEYCVGGGNCGAKKESYGDRHRCFCDKHKHRGDQDLEDNDDNYELVKKILHGGN
jgi:hypothetical protein